MRPRWSALLVLAVVVLAAAAEIRTPFHALRGFDRDAGPMILPLGYLSWVTVVWAARELRHLVGERRRRARGGAVWWRDREWPARGVERRISPGIRGSSVTVTLTVVATFALCAGTFAYAGGMWDRYQRLKDLWVPTSAAVVLAAWVLPLIWLVFLLVPRLGRGQLVVSWPEFPQRTDGRCTFHVGVSPGGATISGVRVFLRCVRVRHRPYLPLTAWNARLASAAEARLPLNSHVGPETEVVATFDVPADAPPTDLHADDSVRWEVLVLGTVGASDLALAVPVPVYAG
jgi:hypothetical protein